MGKINLEVDKQNDDCLYNDKEHKYWNRRSDKVYTSVTTFIGKFKEKFDSEYWSAYKALEVLVPPHIFNVYKSKYTAKKCAYRMLLDKIVDQEMYEAERDKILAKWEKKKNVACEYGTALHLAKENGNLVNDYHYINGEKYKTSYNFDLRELENGVYPEFLVYNNEYGLAGQVDLLIKNGNKITIKDFKTNAKFDTESFYHPRNGYTMMQHPVENIMDCHMGHYTLQLNLYGWMVRQLGDYVIDDLVIEHYTRKGEKTEYKCDIIQDTIDDLVTYGKKYGMLYEV